MHFYFLFSVYQTADLTRLPLANCVIFILLHYVMTAKTDLIRFYFPLPLSSRRHLISLGRKTPLTALPLHSCLPLNTAHSWSDSGPVSPWLQAPQRLPTALRKRVPAPPQLTKLLGSNCLLFIPSLTSLAPYAPPWGVSFTVPVMLFIPSPVT